MGEKFSRVCMSEAKVRLKGLVLVYRGQTTTSIGSYWRSNGIGVLHYFIGIIDKVCNNSQATTISLYQKST